MSPPIGATMSCRRTADPAAQARLRLLDSQRPGPPKRNVSGGRDATGGWSTTTGSAAGSVLRGPRMGKVETPSAFR
ncbi:MULTISPECIES: hypothetical protein [Microvirga]|uniref:hypothetical protein n=1 Tax=Microvirga TaxID=186650 RepID=UPI0021CAC583|nr:MULTISPECIES: hypothetical protein [unclassified Microvirga]